MQFGDRVRELRILQSLTQQTIAERMNVSVSYISKVENGKLHFGDYPSEKFIHKLAGELTGKLKVVKLNTQDNTEVPARYGISAIPTFLIVKGGNVVHQIVGSQPYEAFKKTVMSKI